MVDLQSSEQNSLRGKLYRVCLPGVMAIVVIWIVETLIDTLPADFGLRWTNARIPFLNVPILMHLDKRIAFTAAGFIVAAYGWYIGSSPRQRYISATFPIIFEIVEWFWLLRYPLPSWIDPAAPMYRFASLPISTSALYWLIHILIPGGCILGAVWCLNRLLSALGIAERWPALEARSFVH